MPLFTVVLELDPGTKHEIEYESIKVCLDDTGLETLFDLGIVISAQIKSCGKRVAALPQAIASWDRFKDQVISNSTVLLRGSK